ncbi:unnamed protein product [marine sediment metagenome]|uniref:Uncharacterized protein n=1 Tax=marine sediment metagenome TaxID=412755 RepID=X1D2G8_9ZZZZ
MAKKTWKDGDHHILPKRIQKKNFSKIVNETTIPVSGEEHVKIHRDIKDIGPFGALARHEIRKVSKRKSKKA